MEKNNLIVKSEQGFFRKMIAVIDPIRFEYLHKSTFIRVLTHYASITKRKTSGDCKSRGIDALGQYTYSYGSLNYLDESDIAVGSRYINGINVVNWPISRILLSYFASIYVRVITAMPVKDPTAGFVCYKRKVLESLDLNEIQFIGYAFQIEMKYKAFVKKFKIKEIPIIFTDRKRGVSKLTKSIISEAVKGVIWMRLQKILGKL